MILPHPGDYEGKDGIFPLMLDQRIWEYKDNQPCWWTPKLIEEFTEVEWRRTY